MTRVDPNPSRDFEGWRRAFAEHLAPTSRDPVGLVVDRAEGCWIHGVDGRRYLDLLSGIGVANIGHTHPDVVAAVAAQNARHHHVMVYGEYVQESQARYAEELSEITPEGLDSVYFTSSGAEAIEGAMKLARKATGRRRFVAFTGAYHGDTFGALSVAGNELYRRPFEPLLEPVRRLPFGDLGALDSIDESVAAVLVEPVQGEGGVRIPPDGFLPRLESRCRDTGALLVVDEVLTGFGRTGRLFAVERWGVRPDVLVLAKALGGGYPLGAFVSSRKLTGVLAEAPPLSHVTTFGGHPVSCAAGRAALAVCLREHLAERAESVGAEFLAALRDSFSGATGVREIRGLGMLLGIELDSALRARAVAEGSRERGLLVGWTLHHDHVLRLAPPLVTPPDVLAEAARTVAAVLRDS